MFSIDQNSHSLWDCLPKLQALALKGRRVTHFVEDIDVAFTTMGAGVDGDGLRLAQERFHRSGGADWGAAMFYSNFLGRLPVEIRDWEPLTGMKTNVLAKQLSRSVDDLYNEFSPGDNWQLIGSSYVGDERHHRTIGDLTTEQTAGFLRELLDMARRNTLETFPQDDARRRTDAWFDNERARLDAILAANPARLCDVYSAWLGEYLGGDADIRLSSELFALDPARTALLELFTRDYDRLAELYNRAVEEARVGLRPLKTEIGELPFFAAFQYQGRHVRSGAFLQAGQLRIADMTFALDAGGSLPLEQLRQAGITCLAGKAILLVLQARYGQAGRALTMPYRGSMYMPASWRFQKMLDEAGLLTSPVQPIVRVRFHMLDRMRSLKTTVALPTHLHGCLGRSEIAADELADAWAAIAAAARSRLEKFKDPAARQQWQEEAFADVVAEIAQLDHRRRTLAETSPKSEELRQMWNDMKLRKLEMLQGLLHQIECDWQARDLDYWDSRGALLPWCVALGGEDFYNKVLTEAEIYEEQSIAD